MPLIPRIDGTHIPPRKLGSYRRLHAFLMDSRTESTVFYARNIDVTATLAWISAQKAKLGEAAPSLFQIMLTAAVRTLALRPHLNRFVKGRRFYQRNSITFSFVVKKQYTEKAASTNAKMDFAPDDTLAAVGQRLKGELKVQRSDAKTYNEKEMDGLGFLPRPVLSLAIPLFKFLDRVGLAPGFMIKTDPMYASAYVANLGSVGLTGAPFHPLFNWGTASLFMAIGGYQAQPVVNAEGKVEVRQILPINFSLDNRVLDGLYAAKAIGLLEHFLTHPEELETPPELSAELLAELALKPVKAPPPPAATSGEAPR